MGAGRGRARRTQTMGFPQAATWRETAPATAVCNEIMEAIDRLTVLYGPDGPGWTVEAIAKETTGISSKLVEKYLSQMEGEGIMLSHIPLKGDEPHWCLQLADPVHDPEHDFGWGPVPATQQQRGGGWIADSADVDPLAYVGPLAVVRDQAQVGRGVVIAGSAIISEKAVILSSATVTDRAAVRGGAHVNGAGVVISGNAVVSDDATVLEEAEVSGKARVSGSSSIGKNATVTDSAIVEGLAVVTDYALVEGHASVIDNAKVEGDAQIIDAAVVCENALVGGDAELQGQAKVMGSYKLLTGVFDGNTILSDDGSVSRTGKMIRLEDEDLSPLSF